MVNILENKNFKSEGFWMGGLAFPEAFMTASRQYVA